MKINPIYLKDVTTAEIILEILLAEPDKRMNIVNRYFQPVTEPWQAILMAEFASAAAEACVVMEGKPAYTWLDDKEKGFDLLERVTGHRP